MMGEELARQFTRNTRYLVGRVEGISHDQSLVQPSFEANCVNWTVGHIVQYRGSVARLLDVPLEQAEGLDRYQQESDPIVGDGPDVVPFDMLVERLLATEVPIVQRLTEITDAELAQIVGSGERPRSRLSRLLFLYFHDTLHVGQADVLAELSRSG